MILVWCEGIRSVEGIEFVQRIVEKRARITYCLMLQVTLEGYLEALTRSTMTRKQRCLGVNSVFGVGVFWRTWSDAAHLNLW